MGDIASHASRLSISFRKLWAVQILEKATTCPQGNDYEGENEQAYHESPRPAQPRRFRIRGEGGYYEGNSKRKKSTFARKRAPVGLWMMAAQRCVPSCWCGTVSQPESVLVKRFQGVHWASSDSSPSTCPSVLDSPCSLLIFSSYDRCSYNWVNRRRLVSWQPCHPKFGHSLELLTSLTPTEQEQRIRELFKLLTNESNSEKVQALAAELRQLLTIQAPLRKPSDQQLRIIELVADGLKNREIADRPRN